jgi:hypothetical protein
MEVSGQLQAPAALLPENDTALPLVKRLHGPQSRSGHYREAKNVTSTRTRTPILQ